ncbi:MAG: ribosome maturation factor RimP [Ruminococcaceae bacterium]|nr:ribosome maturation factor RimP [Oscillospiraceae bacterium]
MAGNKNIAATVREGILPTADALGYVLWDVEFLKEGARRILRVTIDNEDGITIDDCEKMHRAIDPILDEIDPIDEAYDLEVSSPGIERELRTDAHIDACIGERVEVRFFAPFEGQKQMEGILAGRDAQNETLLLQLADVTKALPRSAISKLRTLFDF